MAATLTPAQGAFTQELAKKTGLDTNVVAAWVLQEQGGGPQNGANNWLGVGITNAGRYGAQDSIWKSPITAADATAAWMKGQRSVPGYGTSSAGIQRIVTAAPFGPTAQIAAIQSSGWASGGESSLRTLYNQIVSGPLRLVPGATNNGEFSTTPKGNEPDITQGPGGSLTSSIGSLTDAIKWLFTNWLRVLEFVGGAALGFMGLVMLGRAATRGTA